MSIIRYASQANITGAALVSALIIDGADYALKSIKRILAAADIGNGAGQTYDATGGGAPGCLVATISGSLIKDVVSFDVSRPTVADGRTYYKKIDGLFATSTNSYQWTLSADQKSLYIFDASTNAAARLVAGDIIQFLIVTGNS